VVLNSLRSSVIYSSFDFTSAFHAVSIDPSTRHLSAFSTPQGVFYWNSLPTGMSCSPQAFYRFADRMINYEVCYDNNGKVIYENSLPKLRHSPLEGCVLFYDDILVHSTAESTYAKTVEKHFGLIKKVMGRISLHSGKISLEKTVMAKANLIWLGCLISNNFLISDPRRVKKMREAVFPDKCIWHAILPRPGAITQKLH